MFRIFQHIFVGFVYSTFILKESLNYNKSHNNIQSVKSHENEIHQTKHNNDKQSVIKTLVDFVTTLFQKREGKINVFY